MLIQMLLPQKQEEQPNQQPGAALSVGVASPSGPAGGERATTPRADPSLMALPLQGKTRPRHSSQKGEVYCFDEKLTLKCHGADLNPVRAAAAHQ